MLLRNPFTKSLWDQRRSLPAWLLAALALTAMYASFYPSMVESGAETVESYPESMREAFNLTDITSAPGFLSSTVFGIVLPLIVTIYSISAGTKAIAGDEEAGTLELVLAHPVARRSLVVERFGALVVALAGIALAAFVALMLVSTPAELELGVSRYAGMVVHLALLGTTFGALALALGAVKARRGLVLGAAGALALVTWILDAFATQVDGLSGARYVSPFHYYDGGEPLRHGLQLADAGVLVAVTAVLVVVAVVLFSRRDVTT